MRTIITLIAILAFALPTFAQNNAVVNNLTANERAEYTLKFLVKETNLDQEQLISLRQAFFDSAELQSEMEQSLKNSDAQKIQQTLGEEQQNLDDQVADILDAAQFAVYENIRDNLATKISSYKSAKQAAYPTTK